jgi:hypothetical protein
MIQYFRTGFICDVMKSVYYFVKTLFAIDIIIKYYYQWADKGNVLYTDNEVIFNAKD